MPLSFSLLLSITLFTLSFPPFDLWFLGYFFLIPLLINTSFYTHSKYNKFKLGLFFGGISMAIFHTWFFKLFAFGPATGVILLWLALSLYMGIFYGLTFMLIEKPNRPFTVLLTPALWVCFEWLRSIGPIGNPAMLAGYSQANFLPTLQLASVAGVFGLSFSCVLINVLLAQAIISPRLRRFSLLSVLALVIFTASIATIQLNRTPQDAPLSQVALIQPNHEQRLKLSSSQHPRLIADIFTQLNTHDLSQTDLLLLPEIISSSMNLERSFFTRPLSTFLKKNPEITIVFGTPVRKKGKYFNSACVIKPNAITQCYDKVKLMPFGEYWPLKPLFKAFGLSQFIGIAEYSPGHTPAPLPLDDNALGPLICLESIYPWYARQQVQNGANVLLTLVNNAWFFNAKAAAQHLAMSTLRAVETDRYLLQSANTGLSAIISPKGQILMKSEMDVKALLTEQVHFKDSISIYTRFGNWIVGLSILLLLVNRRQWFLSKLLRL